MADRYYDVEGEFQRIKAKIKKENFKKMKSGIITVEEWRKRLKNMEEVERVF